MFIKLKTKRFVFFKQYDLKFEFSILKKLIFALNFFMNCFSDFVHSECYDVMRKIYSLLYSQILTLKTFNEFIRVFYHFSFSFDWERIQFFAIHMNSWSMNEYNRVLIVVSIMLRCWLRNHHIRSFFKNELKVAFYDLIHDFKTKKNFIVFAFVKLIKNNMLISSFDLFFHDDQTVYQQILDAKHCFLDLMNVVHHFIFKGKRIKKSHRMFHEINVFSQSKRNSIFTIFNRFFFDRSFVVNMSQFNFFVNSETTLLFEKNVDDAVKLFNFYIDLHFERIRLKYATLWNCNVLFDENKHKFFKNAVVSNNHKKSTKQIFFKNVFMQTLWCLLNKSFLHIDSKFSRQIIRFHEQCLLLLNNLKTNEINKNEKEFLNIDVDHNKNLMTFFIHIAFAVHCKLKTIYVRNQQFFIKIIENTSFNFDLMMRAIFEKYDLKELFWNDRFLYWFEKKKFIDKTINKICHFEWKNLLNCNQMNWREYNTFSFTVYSTKISEIFFLNSKTRQTVIQKRNFKFEFFRINSNRSYCIFIFFENSQVIHDFDWLWFQSINFINFRVISIR